MRGSVAYEALGKRKPFVDVPEEASLGNSSSGKSVVESCVLVSSSIYFLISNTKPWRYFDHVFVIKLPKSNCVMMF